MKILSLFVLICLSLAIKASAMNCFQPKPLTCMFYRECLETSISCGDDGYAIGYGERYCLRFLDLYPRMSKQGKQFISSTMSCLQKELVNFMDPIYKKIDPHVEICEKITSDAFSSHSLCYTTHAHSICHLNPLTDLPLIFSQYDAQDLMTARSLQQMEEVVDICLFQITEKSFQFVSPIQNTVNHEMFIRTEEPRLNLNELEASYEFWLRMKEKYKSRK